MLGKLVRALLRGHDSRATSADFPEAGLTTGKRGQAAGADVAATPEACAEGLRRADALAQAGKLDAALEACLGAAGALVDLWLIEEAVAAYGRALKLAPRNSAIFSAVLFHLHYRAAVDAPQLFDLHRRFGALAAAPSREVFPQAPAAARRLRIGYLSPNFSRHSVGYFIEPVIRCHERERYEIFCYYSHRLADDATARIRSLADSWREVADIGDEAVARMIREDRIDILVDLAGHTKGNRLGVLARRAAPVQMTWLGYPDTTGLATVDYRITDLAVDPAPQADARHTERLLRMKECFLCYQPPPDAPPVAPRELPAAVVFSSFNNIAKLNDEILRAWGKILAAVPGSRLLLKASSFRFPDAVDRLLESCERCGIEPARVDLRSWVADRRQHLELYGAVDIALDTFPYNGTTTTCESLWMGVPVITLAGDVHMSRVGATLLRSAGLADLVAHDFADYVNTAIALAGDAGRRRRLRAELRARMLASPLLDHAGFTRGLEAHYRHAWGIWCGGRRVD